MTSENMSITQRKAGEQGRQSLQFPYEKPVLRVSQPIGTFYVTVLPAELLLRVAASDVMSASLNLNGVGYRLTGTQRLVKDKRLSQIADYIDRIDSAFPNSIILAANHNIDVGMDQDELEAIELEERDHTNAVLDEDEVHKSKVWTVFEDEKGCLKLRIPSSDKLAAIIDGQHRLFAFAKADSETRLAMDLICAIFLDLPKPLQAQLFATINSTQKPVDRSLTYELFGYNVSDEPEQWWTPDKLAMFLTRKIGTEIESPLRGHITVAPKADNALQAIGADIPWQVSTAVVVDGILRLFSTNPKRDTNAMRTPIAHERSYLRDGARDRSPLREVFVSYNDALIYKVVENYLLACSEVFWNGAKTGSYILKTVGVQALFDILRRKLASHSVEARDVRVAYFREKLEPASDIDFSEQRFRVPAGSGRSIIRKAIEGRLDGNELA